MSDWRPIESAYARILASAWLNSEEMKKLRLEPKRVLEIHGIHLPDNTVISIVDDMDEIRWDPGNPDILMLPIPPRPKDSIADENFDVLLCVSPCCSCCCG